MTTTISVRYEKFVTCIFGSEVHLLIRLYTHPNSLYKNLQHLLYVLSSAVRGLEQTEGNIMTALKPNETKKPILKHLSRAGVPVKLNAVTELHGT